MTDVTADTASPPEATYHVVINDEEQYSIWTTEQPIPQGWTPVGQSGTKEECLAHIEQVWTDMRPRSLREHMAATAGVEPEEIPADTTAPLVDRLSTEQDLEAVLRPDATVAALRSAIDAGYVFVRFTQTRGGTELGVELDQSATDLSEADFGSGSGTVQLTGTLTLDFEPVRCVARLDLSTLTGRGWLESTG
ncbi:MbtH domain-containing protein [Mycobacteroides abscessus M93]|nr:MbtH domain-containing protein [Mycobacteroides abscessus M93]